MFRGARAEIDLGAIRHNLGIAKKLAGKRPVLAVVKADAYGHGAKEVARSLEPEGVFSFVTACVSEALELRDFGVKSRILVLWGVGSRSDRSSLAPYFEFGLTPAINDPGAASVLNNEARRRAVRMDVHVKVDTGMGRLGIGLRNAARDMIGISGMKNLRVEGMMSHFSEADIEDGTYAGVQLRSFKALRAEISKKGLRPFCHMANSAALMSYGDSHLDGVRPGLMLYGLSPFKGGKHGRPLRPAMSVKTNILGLRRLGKGKSVGYGRTFITTRETLVAVIPVGYADGLSRALSNNAEVIVGGRRAPVVGRVCMDLTMVDVTDVKGVKEADEVVLMGRQPHAWEVALRASTIPYETVTSMGGMSRRVFKR